LESRVNGSDLERLAGKMDKIRELMEERFNLVMKLVDRKCEREDLIGVDKRITIEITEINEELSKFAEKEEVVKRLAVLDKSVKKLLDRPWNV